MTDITENDLYYLRSIYRHLCEVRDAMPDNGPLLGSEVMYDNIDWLDCFIDAKTKARPAPADKGGTA